MTALYALDLRQVSPDAWQTWKKTLPEARQKRIAACRHGEDRLRIAGSGILLQLALENAGISIAQQTFAETQAGKPVLAEHPNVHFSLSHSGHWVVCAVSDHAVGVDVESPRCSAAVARRYFHPQEQAFTEDPDALCRIWTAKEAFVKALGTGLTIPLNSFLVRLSDAGAELEQQLTSIPYRLHAYRLDSHCLCLCTADEKPELQLISPGQW